MYTYFGGAVSVLVLWNRRECWLSKASGWCGFFSQRRRQWVEWWQVGVFDRVTGLPSHSLSLSLSLFILFYFFLWDITSIPLFLLFISFHFPNHLLSIFQPFPSPFATIAPFDTPSPPLLTTTLVLSYLPLPQFSPANSTSTNIGSFSRKIPGLFHLGLFARPV